MTIEAISAAIAEAGLVPRGALRLEASERAGELADVRTIVLAGMAGREGWSVFAASPEARDGADHPLDRFSRRVIEGLARDFSAIALFPSFPLAARRSCRSSNGRAAPSPFIRRRSAF